MTKRHVRLKELVDNPETLIELLSKHAQSEAFRARKQTIIDGPHLDPDILFQFATDPFYQATDECARHIGMCPVCKEDYILLLQAHRELWGDDFNPVEVQQFNWGEFLKDKVSSVEMGIRSFVDRWIDIPEPEPAVRSTGFMTTRGGQPTTQRRKSGVQAIKTRQFVEGEIINFDIEIPKDGYVAAFTFSKYDMQLVFPYRGKVDTSVSAHEIKRIRFTASELLGLCTLKAIWTIDDPLGSQDLPFDRFWNDRALQCIAEHIKELDEDKWTAGILKFEVKQK